MSVESDRWWDKPLIVRPLNDEARRLGARMDRLEGIGCHYLAAANDLTPCIKALEQVSESLPSLVAFVVDRQAALEWYGDGLLKIREDVQERLKTIEEFEEKAP